MCVCTYLILTSERASVIKTGSDCLSALILIFSPLKLSADSCCITLGPLVFFEGVIVVVVAISVVVAAVAVAVAVLFVVAACNTSLLLLVVVVGTWDVDINDDVPSFAALRLAPTPRRVPLLPPAPFEEDCSFPICK